MSGAASNYNVSRLHSGIGLAALAMAAGIPAAGKALLEIKSTGLWMSLVSILYSIMMFASSYIEEEQHFWYWATSGWLGWLAIKQ